MNPSEDSYDKSESGDVKQNRLNFSGSLFGLPSPIRLSQVNQLSPAALAYLGDAIYELHIRASYLFPPQRLQKYHSLVVAQVRAEQQANHLRSLHPYLREAELEILKRGRNAASNGPKRVDPEIYQQASSLETLIGFLYLTDPERLFYLLSQLVLDSTTVINQHDSERSQAQIPIQQDSREGPKV